MFKSIPKDLLIGKNSSMNMYIMNFLSIDCSTEIGSLFVKTKNKTFNKVLQSDKLNNDLLMYEILDFLSKNNLKLDNISQIFVNQGPGNFSGLRGSLATAKGISLSKNINLAGYNTFLWSCVKFFDVENYIFSLIKFREKYFIKKFDRYLKSFANFKEISIDEIINKYNSEFKVVPENMKKYFDKKILKTSNIKTVKLNHAELEFLKLKGLLDEETIKPLYIK